MVMIMINENRSVQTDSCSSLTVCELLNHPKVDAFIANKIVRYGIVDKDEAISSSYASILSKFDEKEISTLDEGILFAKKTIHNTVRNLSRSEKLRTSRLFEDDEPYHCDVANPVIKSERYHIPQIYDSNIDICGPLLGLEKKLRDILIAVEVDEDTQSEVAQRFGISRQMVRKNLDRAKQKLLQNDEIIELKKNYN